MAQSRDQIMTAVCEFIHALPDYPRKASVGDYTEDGLLDDLGLDSLDRVELTMSLEEEFNREISDDETERMRSIGDVVTILADA